MGTLLTPIKGAPKGHVEAAGATAPAASKKPSAEQVIRELEVGKAKSLERIQTGSRGSLEVRRLSADVVNKRGSVTKPGAVMFYWRIKRAGHSDRLPIGPYNRDIRPGDPTMIDGGYSVAGAFREAERMAGEDAAARKEGSSLREQMAAREAEKKAREAADKRASEYTLGALLDDYVSHVAANSSAPRTAQDIAGIFRNHIPTGVKAKPACEVTGDDVIDVLRAIHRKGKARTADKCRSYLAAAFNLTIRARREASIPERFAEYGVTANPVQETVPSAATAGADKDPLSARDLRRYWKAIKGLEGVKGCTLRLHVLLGGQRIEQLLRARVSDVRDGMLRLVDSKGSAKRPPREHFIPLLGMAVQDVAELSRGKAPGAFLFSTDGGKTAVASRTLGKWADEAAASAPADPAEASGTPGIHGFKPKRVRSGVETLLAAEGVSRDIRGQLQSHGLGGVQAKHYDGHDYSPEKAGALMQLERLLSDEPAPAPMPLRVVKLRAA